MLAATGCACRRAAEVLPCARRWRFAGLQKVVDYQDVAYGGEYLDRLAIPALDRGWTASANGYALSIAAANTSPTPCATTT